MSQTHSECYGRTHSLCLLLLTKAFPLAAPSFVMMTPFKSDDPRQNDSSGPGNQRQILVVPYYLVITSTLLRVPIIYSTPI